MLIHIVKRLFGLIPVLLGTMFIVFMVLHLSPDDPAAFALGGTATPEAIWEWNEMFGLNDPVLIQYVRYMAGVFRGDFGTSFRGSISITLEVMQRVPNTLWLSLTALSISLILAFPIGILAAVKKNTWIDGLGMFIALISISIPVFFLGLLLVLFSVLNQGWLPVSGLWHWRDHIRLPAITLGVGMLGAMICTTRFSIIEVLNQGYIRTANAKGLTKGEIIRKHVMRNALMPILTGLSTNLGAFFTSIVLVEMVFAWPGIGRLMILGFAARDYPLVLGCLFMFILFYAIINVLVDIVRAFADPCIRAKSV